MNIFPCLPNNNFRNYFQLPKKKKKKKSYKKNWIATKKTLSVCVILTSVEVVPTFLFRLDFTASRRNLRKMFGINLPINAYISKARVMS